MRYVAAYLLAVLGGNNKPTDKDLMKILGSVGIDADGAAMTKVVKELSGKSIEQVIAAGNCNKNTPLSADSREKTCGKPSVGSSGWLCEVYN